MHTQGNSSFWWKVVEAALLSLGVVKDLLESQQKENQLPLDIVVILQSSLDQHNRMAGENNFGLNKKKSELTSLSFSASPCLLGRCLWAASRFASFLPTALLNRYLQATVEALQPHQNVILRITAVR
jgi:hypothetical protein